MGKQNKNGNIDWYDASMFPGPPFLDQRQLWATTTESVTAENAKSYDGTTTISMGYKGYTPGMAATALYFVKKGNYYTIGFFFTIDRVVTGNVYLKWFPVYEIWAVSGASPWPWYTYHRDNTHPSGKERDTYDASKINTPEVGFPWTVFESDIY